MASEDLNRLGKRIDTGLTIRDRSVDLLLALLYDVGFGLAVTNEDEVKGKRRHAQEPRSTRSTSARV